MTNRNFKVGLSREQGSFLPPRIEDYVAPDNPVRAIEAYVSALDLAALGFRYAEGDGGAGQPPYDPADLLKLYLYGYLNQVRSSRRLEREAGRNVELIWLLRGLVPGYRTIGNFRKDNRNALKAANRDFDAQAAGGATRGAGARYRGLWRRSGGQRRGRGDEDATKGATGPGHCREDYGAAGETCEGQSRSGEAGG